MRSPRNTTLFAVLFFINFIAAAAILTKSWIQHSDLLSPFHREIEDSAAETEDFTKEAIVSVNETENSIENETEDSIKETFPSVNAPNDSAKEETHSVNAAAASQEETASASEEPEMTQEKESQESVSEPAPLTFTQVGPEYFEDALFIGDSRTLGLSEYGTLTAADYFAKAGMSVFNIGKATVSISDLGTVSLADLLAQKHYGKIYVMLGINELGYSFEKITVRYENLLNQIQEAQPHAILYVCANLHVAAGRSSSDDVFNNTNIDLLNSEIAKFADDRNIFYINVNERFDDASGNLDVKYTGDASQAHLLGKYYAVWSEWLCTKAIQR